MTLSTKNWLVRFAWIGSDYRVPTQTSLCALFWRIVWRLIVGSFLLFVASVLLLAIYKAPLGALAIAGAAVALVGFLAGVAAITSRVYSRGLAVKSGEIKPSVIEEILYAVKNRFCPIIKLKE